MLKLFKKFILLLEFSLSGNVFIKTDKWFCRGKQVTDKELQSHIDGKNTVALCHTKTTNKKIFVIDLDNHSGLSDTEVQDIYEHIISLFGIPVFQEQSLENNGYHLYYKFSNVTKEIWRGLGLFFKLNNFHCDFIAGKQSIRLPFSKDYFCEHSLEESINLLENAEERILPESTIALIEKNESIMFDEKKVDKKISKDLVDSLFGVTLDRFITYPISPTFGQKFIYGSGDRWRKQNSLAIYCVSAGYSFKDFVALAIAYDRGSNSMKKSESEVYELLSNKFQSAKLYTQRIFLTEEERQIAYNFFYNRLIKMKVEIYRKRRARALVDAYLLCRVLARQENQRQYSGNLSHLNEGFTVPKNGRIKLGLQWGISNFDKRVQELKKMGVLDSLKLSSGIEYAYKKGFSLSCHYILKDIQSGSVYNKNF
jgi:hypothetical protein